MRATRKKVVSVSLVIMLVLLGLAALAPTSSAGFIGDVPVRPFKIDKISWDKAAQEFVIEMSLKFGLATAGERAGFVVSTGMKIDTGQALIEIEPQEDPVRKVARAEKGARNMVEIEPQRIPWDRDDGTVTGTIVVTVWTVIINPGGGGMTQIDPPTLEINADVPDPDNDND